MTYAARDAQVSIALFLHLLGFQSEASPASSSGSSYSELASRCQGLVDVPFKGQGDRDDRAGDGDRKRRARSLGYENPESGDQQVSDPRKNHKRKSLGAGYSARWVLLMTKKLILRWGWAVVCFPLLQYSEFGASFAQENMNVNCFILSLSACSRKSPLYDNCFLHAPDGQPLCTCDKKKAKWYLDKGIGGMLDKTLFIAFQLS